MKEVKLDCRYFKGHIPCKPHKKSGVSCSTCQEYEKISERICIIKLGAIGDVIRTTPLLHKLKSEFPNSEITWLTQYPDVVPKKIVDNILEYKLSDIQWLVEQNFDWLINLDKDREAIALFDKINALKKSGFKMDKFGKCIPAGNTAEYNKWLTGLWDNLNKANRLNYMQEIFLICGYTFNSEDYILEFDDINFTDINNSQKVVGLNTGSGSRWVTRLWPEKYWIELANLLLSKNCEVIILGGEQEHEKNQRISNITGAKYLGVFPLNQFISLVNKCDIIVTQVTMAMHIAIALKKELILMNNIFNKNEFYLYGKGRIFEPSLDCLGCFKQKFDERCPVRNCMELISVDSILKYIEESF